MNNNFIKMTPKKRCAIFSPFEIADVQKKKIRIMSVVG